MLRKIVFDIETRNTFQQVNSRDPAALDLSVIVVYDYASDRYHSFTQEELSGLWPLLEQADLLIGYNSDHFDIPLLNKYYPGDLRLLASLDLLDKIKEALGKRLPLDAVAAGTLGAGKTASGLEAVRWWQEGQIEKIRHYCQADVRLTKEIYDFARANNYLQYKFFNQTSRFPLDASGWEDRPASQLNYTLPF